MQHQDNHIYINVYNKNNKEHQINDIHSKILEKIIEE